MARSKMDKLKDAGSSLDKLFTGASETTEKASETTKKTTKRNTKTEPEKVTESPQKAQEGKKPRVIDTHKVFSFRAPRETVDSWRVWAEAKGLKVDELGTLALTEYIKKHSLTADQRQIYELKMAQKKS